MSEKPIITDNSEKETTPKLNAETNNTKRPFKRWAFALCLMTIGGMVYGEIDAQWISSYIKNVAGMGYFGSYLIMAIATVLGAISYLIWGVYSDNLRTKLGRRIPLYLGGTIGTFGIISLFILTTRYELLFILGAFILPIFTNMYRSTRGLTPDLFPQEKRGKLNTLLLIMSNVGSMIIWIPTLLLFPGETKIYSPEIHRGFILFGAGVLAITGVVIALLIKEPKVTEPPHKWTNDLKSVFSWGEMQKQQNFYRLFVAMFFLVASESTFLPFLLNMLQDIDIEFNADLLIKGAIVGACIGIGVFLMGKYTDKIGRKTVTLIGVIFCPIGCLIVGFSNSDINVLMVGFAIMMPFYVGSWVAIETWMQDILPGNARGRFFGILNVGSAIGKALGMLLAAYVAEQLNVLGIFLVGGILMWICIPFILRVPETLQKTPNTTIK
jgi:MFS family permease